MQSLLEPVTVDIHYLILERKEIMGKKKGIQIILTVALVVAMVAGSVAGSMAATTSQKAAQAKNYTNRLTKPRTRLIHFRDRSTRLQLIWHRPRRILMQRKQKLIHRPTP